MGWDSIALPNGTPPRTASWRSAITRRTSGSSAWEPSDCRADTTGTPAPTRVESCLVRSGRKSWLPMSEKEGKRRAPSRLSATVTGYTPSEWSFLRAAGRFSASRLPFCSTPAFVIAV